VGFLKKLNPDKLHVEYRNGLTPTWPIIPRLYTLTHSDLTGDLFLTIGKEYAGDRITEMRDEVLGEWIPYGADDVALLINILVDGKDGIAVSEIRNKIFNSELPLALEAIIYGDRYVFEAHPQLNNSPIFIQFNSIYPQFNRMEHWKTIYNYK
jgi:hypothetical protein